MIRSMTQKISRKARTALGSKAAPVAAAEPPLRATGLGLTMTAGQSGRFLELTLAFRPDITAHRLWGRLPDQDVWIDLGALADESRRGVYAESMDLERLLAPDVLGSGDGATVHLYVDLDVPIIDVRRLEAESEVALLVVPGAPRDQHRGRYRLQLGSFRQTQIARLNPREVDGHLMTVHPTRTGHLAVEIDRELPQTADVLVSRLSTAGGVLRMKGEVQTYHADLEVAELLLKWRTIGLRRTWPFAVQFDTAATRKGFGLRVYRFDVRIPWADVLDDEAVGDDALDTWLLLRTSQSPEPFEVRVGKTRFWARYFTRPGWASNGHRAAMLTPYYTLKAKRTSFYLDLFEPDVLDYLRRTVRNRHLLRLAHRGRRPIWMIGERPYKAQDNGLHFFRYLRENHPEIDAYYVLEPSSAELANVEPLGNVLAHRSKEHVRVTMLADRIFGTHHPDFIYPLRTRQFRKAVAAQKVFLQHGVMGTKWLTAYYGKGVEAFETDLFIVSSKREKEYIVGDFGWDPREVAVTGLARFDGLLAPDTAVRRQLLIIPTWREWLQNDAENYLASEYHERWAGLLHDPRLIELAAAHDLELVFCLHPNMQQYRELFDDVNMRVISQGEVDVQLLMKESAVLLTDFSSVGFDFSFLHRPVVYYQFDQTRYLNPMGSHLDLDAELPGPILFTADDVLAELERLADNDFLMDPMYLRRADRFLTHRDRRSSERIFEAAQALRSRSTLLRRLGAGEVPTAAWRYFRRSPLYYPSMRWMMRALKRLPADDSLMVFESGVGRQYADSPRYVYEELVRRELPLRKVWAYNGKIFQRDEDTKVVQRLSPSYFWYLARARYWVSNQNFPHYVERRPDGVYLQTWHGTPLKRLLHDLDAVVGRDSGYRSRVTKAAAQWSLLASPSAWATDRMRSAFRYEGPVVEVGYPRNDIFFREDRDELAASVRRRLGIPADKTVVLYAPTFRDDQATAASRFAFRLAVDLDALRAALGDDVVFLIRKHGLAFGTVPIPPEHATHIKDVSSYSEIQELFVASDVLVTDYSSVFFDFACLRRPMIFYAYDLDSYRDELRGFYLDYERELPGPIVTTEKELFATLQNLDAVTAEYAARYDDFIAKFSPRDDGHAASRLVDEMLRRGPRGSRSRGTPDGN